MQEPQVYDAVIIGAGFAGMYQLICLRDKLGLKARVLEAAAGVGGTWYWNRYPGARCDSESYSYMYYFSKDLIQEWSWSERYPQQPEILRYLNHVADKFQLRDDIELDTQVSHARFDSSTNQWVIKATDGKTFHAKYLITAVGCLSSANIPEIKGLWNFRGSCYHTGTWPHEEVSFDGKRVGVIGTGSTGIQVIPVVAKTALELTVFQRTANYSLPARNHPLSAEFKQHVKDHADDIYHVMTHNANGHPFNILMRDALSVSESERKSIYEKAWEAGGFRFRSMFQDLLTNECANKTAADFIKEKIRETVRDPKTASTLADIDHPFAAKRPPLDTQYFESYNRENVNLVNLRSTPIKEIVPDGIRTTERDYPLDIIVFATGFDALTGPLIKLNLEGINGRTLRKDWQAGPSTYLGLQIPGYPNLFTITGPGSPSVLCNMPPAIEQHVQWITDCISYVQENGFATVQTFEKAAQDWQAEVDRAANATLLPRAKHSWYLGANVPGKPLVFMPYAGGLAIYRDICNEVARDGYRGFAFG